MFTRHPGHSSKLLTCECGIKIARNVLIEGALKETQLCILKPLHDISINLKLRRAIKVPQMGRELHSRMICAFVCCDSQLRLHVG